MRHCRGYAIEGPDCKTATGQSSPEARESIRTAARESDLLASPAAEPEEIMVGGGQTWGEVFLDEGRVVLPAKVAARDEARVAAVLQAIAAAIPADLTAETTGD
jgi:hypothetical protein